MSNAPQDPAEQAAACPATLFVVSAPSGAGKTSLLRAMLATDPGLVASISYTTRAPRPGEADGREYHFVDTARFLAMAEAGEFLEHAQVFDHHYGTAGAAVLQQLATGRDVVLEIDWQGARQIHELLPTAVRIFILPPSVETLRERLRGRGDQAAVIERRMRDALSELSHYDEYDYLVVNGDFDRALDDLRTIVRAQRLRTAAQAARHADLLAALQPGRTAAADGRMPSPPKPV